MSTGSGGIGAVSVGLSPLLLLILVAVVAGLAFGGWKVIKILLLALKG